MERRRSPSDGMALADPSEPEKSGRLHFSPDGSKVRTESEFQKAGTMKRVQTSSLQIAPVLHDFIEREALNGTGILAEAFWNGLAGLVRDFAPRNRELLAVRDRLQSRIDEYHRSRAGQPFDQAGYESFLREIGYLRDEPAHFTVSTRNVDDEIARTAGPQLV